MATARAAGSAVWRRRRDVLRPVVLQRPWGRLAVWRGGSGPVLLALHGLGGSGRYWEGLARRVGHRFAVVAPDHGGFGHSDKPSLRYDREFHLGNLDAVAADVAGGEPVVVVGHSLGGVMAALWAARRPDDVAALALVAALYPSSGRGEPDRDRRTEERDGHRSRQLVYRGLQAVWPWLSLPVRSRTFPRAVIADYMLHTLPSYWGTANALLWDSATEAELAGLDRLGDQPALILGGLDDRRVAPGDADLWAARLPRAERRSAPGGHQVLLRTHFAPLADWLEALPITAAGAHVGASRQPAG